ncbi:MAG: DUF3892 domain-containing protein [bacterium]|nr:DUF3892 domain-containing protein [bacterium]
MENGKSNHREHREALVLKDNRKQNRDKSREITEKGKKCGEREMNIGISREIFRELKRIGTGKLADYYISGVGYKARQQIERARVHKDRMGKLGTPEIWFRKEIISKIEEGSVFSTVYKDEGVWKRGEDVDTIEIEGVKYIRTDRNRSGEDNLGNLPEIG